MTWIAALGPAAVTALALYAPGWLLLVGLRRRWTVSLVLAPVVSAAVLGAAALGLSVLGISWSLGSVALVALVGAIVGWALGRFTGGGPLQATFHAPGAATMAWPAVAGLALNACVLVVEFVRPTGSPQGIAQIYDTPFHMALIRRIVDTGDASPLHAGALDGTAGSGFYPALWHATVALAVQATGTSIATAVNASVLVLLGLVWPLSVAALTVVVFGRRPTLVFASTATAGILAVFPWGFLVFGVLYSNLFSFTFAPACLAVVVWIAGRVGRSGRPLDMSSSEILSAVVLLLAMMGGLALAQPNTLFTLAITVLPLLYGVVWRLLAQRHRMVRAGMLGGLTIVVVGAWIVAYHLPALRRTVTWVWPSFETVPQAVGEVALQGFNSGPGQVLVALLVAAGVVLAWLRHRRYWYVVAFGLLCLLYVLAAGLDGTLRDLATGFWYHDSTRLAAGTALLAVPLLAVAVEALVTAISGHVRRLAHPVPVTAALVVVVLVVATGAGPGLAGKRYSLSAGANHDPFHFLDDDERSFLDSIEAVVGDDVIANNPYDGSAFAYSLYGENVLFKTFQGNWLGVPTDDQRAVMAHLKDAAADTDSVCTAVRKLDVRYALRLANHPQTLNYLATDWVGVEVDDTTPGFTLVERSGDLSLYRVTACSVG